MVADRASNQLFQRLSRTSAAAAAACFLLLLDLLLASLYMTSSVSSTYDTCTARHSTPHQ